jgi:N-acetylglucosaminyldiphosphoundecaprenol N-acetyl-beta-D-mannosaminyltransferase
LIDVDKLKLKMSTPAEIARLICKSSLAGEGLSINLINSYSFTNIRKNKNYRNALFGNCANYVDGKPLSLYLALRHRQIRINSRGMEILTESLTAQEGLNIENFFVYFERSDANRLMEYAQQFIPAENVILVPVSDQLEIMAISQQLIQTVQTSNSHIVWIMLGSPKQEIVSSLISNSLSSPVIGLGGVIDFITGKVPEAPRILQIVYLEWLFRLIKEPLRLFKRYTFGNVVFLQAVGADFFYTTRSRRKSELLRLDKTIEFHLSRH